MSAALEIQPKEENLRLLTMLHFATWKTVLILGVVAISVLFALPNVLPVSVRAQIPGFLPSQPANLGLDLQGGSHLEFQVKLDDVFQQRLESFEAELRQSLIKAKIGYTGLRTSQNEVSVTIRDPAQLDVAAKAARDLAQPIDTGAIGLGGKPDIEVTQEAGGRLRIRLTEQAQIQLRTATLSQSIEVVRRRIDETGTKEPIIQRQGADRIVVEVPGVSDPQQIKDLMAQTARLTFHRVDTSVSLTEAQEGRVPPGSVLLEYQKPEAGRTVELVEKRAVLTGQDLKSARTAQDQMGLPAVAFTLNPRGAKIFGDYTSANVGQRFAIVLDNKVISAPVIRSPILGGSGEISGGFASYQEAEELKILLNAGALPASLEVVNERTVGAELGQDSIDAGITASVIGGCLVILFMVIAYNLFGVFANVALIANIIILLAAVSMLRVTLTLPGIAGIVLTIGVAVDSNVLVYERVKEELRAGKTMISSLQAGFTRAFSTIVDANLTTLLSSIVLFILGAGPVRGFAVIHALGTLTTIFTAYTLTRLIVATWLRRAKPKRIPIDPRPREDGKVPFRILPDQYNMPFIKLRNIGFALSGAGLIGSIVLALTMGLNFGIDFRGGTLVEIHTGSPADLGKIRGIGGDLNLGRVQVQEFGSPQDVVIRLESQEGGDAAQQAARAKLIDALNAELGQEFTVSRTEVVGPTVGRELVWKGVTATVLGIGLMMVYVWFRFEWQFGLGAVVGLVHDIILTIGIFALFQLPFELPIIAALLTIIGFSMNDKVVIYDRIRENLRKYKRLELKALINQSLNEVFSRTMITAITTLLALGALYVFGGEALRVFVFAMIWGIFVGTYSSLFISAPFLLYTGVKREWSRAATAGGSPAGSKA